MGKGGGETISVVETKQERIVCTTGDVAIHIFMVRVPFYFMYHVLVLLVSCGDSNIPLFTQKINVRVSPSAESVCALVCKNIMYPVWFAGYAC